MTVQVEEIASTDQTLYFCERLGIEFGHGSTKRAILEDIGFSVRRGEFVSVLGPSGTGKTTLLRALGGLVAPTAGSAVTFDGSPVKAPPNGVVIVFQNYTASLLPWRTVEQNVGLGLERTTNKKERAARVKEVLDMVGLGERAGDYPWRLSGGMQQRVQIARALAMQPKVLLMDEPFGALDAMTKSQLQDEMARLSQVMDVTVIFVTHDIEEAVYLSDRIVVLNGTPARVTAEIEVDLPRPRNQITTKEMPEYLKLRHSVYAAIESGDSHAG